MHVYIYDVLHIRVLVHICTCESVRANIVFRKIIIIII